MIKKIFLSVLLSAVVASLYAKEPESVQPQSKVRCSELFSFQIGGGVNLAIDNIKQDTGLYGFTPVFDAAFAVKPIDGLGLRAGFQGFKATRDDIKFDYKVLRFDVMWNFADSKGTDFILSPYVSLGETFTSEMNSLGFGPGLVLGYRISDAFDIVLDSRAYYYMKGEIFPNGSGECMAASSALSLVFNF